MIASALAAGRLSIAKIYTASTEEWNHIYHGCNYSTFFHSREWTEIWHQINPDDIRSIAKVIVFSDQKKALIPFALRQRAKGLMNTYTCSIEGTFGGWISADELEIEHVTLLVNYLKSFDGNLAWRVNPYDNLLAEIRPTLEAGCHAINLLDSKRNKVLLALKNFFRPIIIHDDTHTVNLKPGFSALYKSQSSIVRKAKKAQKAGVTITFAETLEEWREYYQVYQSSLERWHKDPSTAYTWEVFEQIFRFKSPNVKLWVAVYEGKIVSGALCFYSKNHVIYWHGAALKEHFELRPVNLMMLEIIKDACEQGFSWYDFNPSGNMQGVIAFKESFGAKPLPCPLIYVDTPVKRLARAAVLATRGYF